MEAAKSDLTLGTIYHVNGIMYVTNYLSKMMPLRIYLIYGSLSFSMTITLNLNIFLK